MDYSSREYVLLNAERTTSEIWECHHEEKKVVADFVLSEDRQMP